MRLDTRYLDTFLSVCEMGGIARAANQLHLTQPAVSHRIKVLERQLHTKLFEHQGRSLILTQAGRRLQKISTRYLNELSTFHTELIHKNSEWRETLRIGSVSGFGRYILFPFLCMPDFNHLRLHLTYPTADEIFEEVENGAYELGFVYHRKMSHTLKFQIVYQEELVLITAKELVSKLQQFKDLNNYSAFPFITYDESDYVFGKWFDAFFGRQPRTIPSLHHFEELEEVIEMILHGEGISIVPDYVVSSEVSENKLLVLRPFKRKCNNQVYAVTRTENITNHTIEVLLAKIQKKEPHLSV